MHVMHHSVYFCEKKATTKIPGKYQQTIENKKKANYGKITILNNFNQENDMEKFYLNKHKLLK